MSESPETTPLSAEEIYREHRECGTPNGYDGCYSHVPMKHCRADGMLLPCDVMLLQRDAARATVPAGPEHALHFDPDCEECAYLARPTTGDAAIREAARLHATAIGGSGADSEAYLRHVIEAFGSTGETPNADDRLREAAQRVVAAKPVRWNDRPADSFIEAVGVLRTTLDAARATVPAGPEHALHFDPDCEECAYLARPTRETLGSPSTGDDRLRERLAAVVQKWSGHLSERMLDDLERAARATVPAGPGHCRCEDHLQAALTEGCRCADHVHDGLEAARPVPAAEPRDPWIVVTDDCEACGALVGASHAANCVATEWGRPLHVWTGSPSTGDAR
jgi:hypothetical protein